MSIKNTCYKKLKKNLRNTHEIVVIQRMVEQNQKISNKKERLQEKANNCYINLSKEGKNITREYGRLDVGMSQETNQKLK